MQFSYKIDDNFSFLNEIKWNGIFKVNNTKISQGSRRGAPFFIFGQKFSVFKKLELVSSGKLGPDFYCAIAET